MLRRFFHKKNIKDWEPIIKDKPEDIDKLVDRLIRWNKEPSLEPELEEWFKYGYPKNIPYDIVVNQNEIYFDKYYPMYQNALKLEGQGDSMGALDIYLEILGRFRPLGMVYYEKPIQILETKGRYQEAMIISNNAIKAIDNKLFNGDIEFFKETNKRLKNNIINQGG